MKKVFLIVGIIIIIGVVYMTIRITVLVKDDTVYDVSGNPAQSASEEFDPNAQVIQDGKEVAPTNEEIVTTIFPDKDFERLSDNEFAPKLEEGVIGNTFVISSITRGDLDRDLYIDAFAIVEITGAASVSNTAYLVTRKGVFETLGGSVLEGRVLFAEGGFTNNKQLYIVFIQAVTGEKERALYDYSVINGEMKLTKISSKVTPGTAPTNSPDPEVLPESDPEVQDSIVE